MEKIMWLFRYVKLLFNPMAEYFGVCPKCLETDGCLNIERDHVFVCHRHKSYWLIGFNIFSSWRREDESVWEKNSKLLESYEIIEPYNPGDRLWPLINWCRNLRSKIFKDESIPF